MPTGDEGRNTEDDWSVYRISSFVTQVMSLDYTFSIGEEAGLCLWLS
jgi:hypothetical protein